MKSTLVCFFTLILSFTVYGNVNIVEWYSELNILTPNPKVTYSGGVKSDLKSQYVEELVAIVTYNINSKEDHTYQQEVKELNKVIYGPVSVFEVASTADFDNVFDKKTNRLVIGQDYLSKSTFAEIGLTLLRTYMSCAKIDSTKVKKLEALFHSDINFDESNLKALSEYMSLSDYTSVCNCFSGRWETDYGGLVILPNKPRIKTHRTGELNHARVEGYYQNKGDAKKIEGTVVYDDGKCVLSGKWIRKNDDKAATLRFTSSRDRKSFQGYWVTKEGQKAQWNGNRIDMTFLPLFGIWNTTKGTLILYPLDDGIAGYFENNSGQKNIFVSGEAILLEGGFTFKGFWVNIEFDYGNSLEFTSDFKGEHFTGNWKNYKEPFDNKEWSGEKIK